MKRVLQEREHARERARARESVSERERERERERRRERATLSHLCTTQGAPRIEFTVLGRDLLFSHRNKTQNAHTKITHKTHTQVVLLPEHAQQRLVSGEITVTVATYFVTPTRCAVGQGTFHTFSKVLYTVTWYRKYTRALSFENETYFVTPTRCAVGQKQTRSVACTPAATSAHEVFPVIMRCNVKVV